MPEYLLEFYVSRSGAHAAADDGDSARAAAEELTRRGTAVRYQRSIFVPDEETCFLLFEAESAEAVRDAALLANLPAERISVVSEGGPESGDG
jgi:hypothetical protein